MVEFVPVFMVLLLLFLCIIELWRFALAELMLQRAAGIAVRACAVMKDQPAHCDANVYVRHGQHPGQDDEVARAASAALAPLTDSQLQLDTTTCTTAPPSDTDRAELKARFRCAIPLARNIICPTSETGSSHFDAGERTRSITALAQYPHQGARYDCWYAPELELPGVGTVPAGEWQWSGLDFP